ncbi:MAG: hypothetical protein HYS08_06620 [Chlamydiae bacterium]|nr:hypothetical protein [Chlamydiota bacterium]MBI3267082.1 hypothetical protein [Chlamydiota bacterium]
MKTISIGFEDSLFNEMNEKAKILKTTRSELVRNAIMEYLFRFDEILDAKMLQHAIEKDESKKSLNQIAHELGLA